MTLDNSLSLNNKERKNNTWKIFLILVVFLLSVISIYFLFRHFKSESPPRSDQNSSISTENQEKDSPQPSNNNQEQNNYQPIQSTQKEPEYRGTKLPISSVGAEYKKAATETNRLPRGSAILTGSGDLKKQGIKAIIHACPGSIEKTKDKDFQPNIQGIIRSVQNSIILAERNGCKKVAFCLIGSNFLDSIISPNQGNKKERQIKLAEIIIKAAIEQRKGSEIICFVDFGNDAFGEAWQKVHEEGWDKITNTFAARGHKGTGESKKNIGIADYKLHKCEVIVNSLNTEGEFINSGSFSGFIAGKTGSEKNKIQKEIKKCIDEFNKRLVKEQ